MFELFIAIRYLVAGRKQAFISVISFISIIGVGVGVMALLVVLALMTGLQGELRDRIIGSAAHVYVFKAGGIEDADAEVRKVLTIPRVVGAAPVLQGKALITTPRGGEAFIEVKGIVPQAEKTVTEIETAMQAGSLDALNTGPDQPNGILIGRDLATRLNVTVGDSVQVMSPEGTLTPFGPIMRQRPFSVVGLFRLGLFQFDEGYGFVHLDVAKRMLGKDYPDYIEVRVDNIFAAQEVADAVVDRLGSDYLPQTWSDMNHSLFSALWLEKMAMSITIGLIVMVAALNIVASLVLLVMEKNRDIAILKTMGTSSASIRRIFMLQGLIIGVIGTTAGALAGRAAIYVLDRYKLIRLPTDVYQISYVPFTLELDDFIVVIVAAVLICFVATIYPSRQAAKLDPAQALRYQ